MLAVLFLEILAKFDENKYKNEYNSIMKPRYAIVYIWRKSGGI